MKEMFHYGLRQRIRFCLSTRPEHGFTLLEVLLAILILSIISLGLVASLGGASKTLLFTDTRETARNFAQYEMEYIKALNYSPGVTTYPAPITHADYPGFTAANSVTTLHANPPGEQQITVTVTGNNVTYTLQDYKIQ
jgi:prepilin-type N-terminal cleavage/methylation domain-containing protein